MLLKALRVQVDAGVDVGNKEVKTTDADDIMEDVMYALSEFVFSKAEMFYMHCQLTNPKDVWNEFTFVDTIYFQVTAMMCFGQLFTEDIAFKNWLNRKP